MIEKRFVDQHARTFLKLAMRKMPVGDYRLVTRADLWKIFLDKTHVKLNQMELHFQVTGKIVTADDEAAFKKMIKRFIEDAVEHYANTCLRYQSRRSAGQVNVAE